jgi:hypothetical protein
MYSYEHNSMNEVWNKISIIYNGPFLFTEVGLENSLML